MPYPLRRALSLIVIPALAMALSASPLRAQTADEVREATGVEAGVVAQVPATDGKLLADFAATGRVLAHGLALDRDAANKVEAAIEAAHVEGLAMVDVLSQGGRLPYADNLVNLLIVDNDVLGKLAPADGEVLRVLVPLKGVAYIKSGGAWKKITKPMPKEYGEWPQYSHGPGWNAVNDDQVAGPAEQLQWLAGRGWSLGKGASSGYRLVGGMAFHHSDADKELIGRDAFNGVPIWRMDVKGISPRVTPLIATPERLYTVIDREGPLVTLDAATGKRLNSFDTGVTAVEKYRRDMPMWGTLSQGLLIQTGQHQVVATRADTGEKAWSIKVPDDVEPSFPIVAEDLGLVFYVEGNRTPGISRWPQVQKTHAVVAIDLKTGQEKWRNVEIEELSLGELCYDDGTIGWFGDTGIGTFAGFDQKSREPWVGAIDAKSGKLRWKQNHTMTGQVVLQRDGNVYVGEAGGIEGFNAQTGEKVVRWKADSNPNCNRLRGTSKWWITSAVTYIGEDYDWQRQWITRSVCAAGGWPAYGMVYFVPNGCSCFTMVRGYLALNSRPAPQPLPVEGRLETFSVDEGDYTSRVEVTDRHWTTWGGTGERTFSNDAVVPAQPKQWWRADVSRPMAETTKGSPILADWTRYDEYRGGPVEQPVIGYGMVYATETDKGRIVAIHTNTGERAWEFFAGGRIDSSPTLIGWNVIFGSRDGYVYALDAHTGELRWRFMAAPNRELIVANGQLESQWPVIGSVLAHAGSIWTSAGRHPELGGGIHLYQLAPATGKVLWQGNVGRDEHNKVYKPGEDMPREWKGNGPMREMNGVKQGMLATDGDLIYLAALAIDPKTHATDRLGLTMPYAFPGNKDDDNSKRIILDANLP